MRLLLVTVTTLMFSIPAIAADFTKKILDEDGKPFTVCIEQKKGAPNECVREEDLTLGRAARNALGVSYPDEQGISGDEKYHRAEVSQAIVGATELKLKAEDVALIKRLIAKFYGPRVVFQAWRELDPPAEKKP